MTSVVPSFDLRIATTGSCKLKLYIFFISLGPETPMEAIEMVAQRHDIDAVGADLGEEVGGPAEVAVLLRVAQRRPQVAPAELLAAHEDGRPEHPSRYPQHKK